METHEVNHQIKMNKENKEENNLICFQCQRSFHNKKGLAAHKRQVNSFKASRIK